MIRQTPEERAEYIIRTEALYGPAIDTNSIRTAIAVTVREAIEQERESNPLLAASPDLLAALEAIEAHHVEQNRAKGRDESRSHTLALARAAIAKAKGES